MEIKREVEPKDYPIGVIVARFQVKNLHDSHLELLADVCANHKKVILFLGVSNAASDEADPMDFATRKVMVQELYPEIVILPLQDRRYEAIYNACKDNEIISMVADSYDYFNAVEYKQLPLPLRSKNEGNGKVVVARPDSGDAEKEWHEVLFALKKIK